MHRSRKRLVHLRLPGIRLHDSIKTHHTPSKDFSSPPSPTKLPNTNALALHGSTSTIWFYYMHSRRSGIFEVCHWSSLFILFGAQISSEVAPTAVWALDYCLTIEHEVRLFSSMGRWGIVTVMFIVARYAPIAWIISEIYVTLGPLQTCLTTYQAAGVSLSLTMLATEGLLLVRTLALWHNNKKIKWFLLASYLVAAISMITCNTIARPLLQSVCVPISTQSDSEVATKLEHLIMGGFVSTALFELIVATITLYHSILLRSSGMHTLHTLASTLSKGNFLYALSLFAISVANIVSFSLPVSGGYSGIVDVFQGVLHGVMASRIMFDLRDADRSKEDTFFLSDLQCALHTISTTT